METNDTSSAAEQAVTLDGNNNFELLSGIDPAKDSSSQKLVANILNGESNGQEVRPESDQKVEKGKEEVVSTPTTTAGEGAKDSPATPETPPPAFKFKVGDTESEIQEDATFTVKVKGQEEKVAIKDLVRNYQGKVPWEKHYQELKEDRKRFDESVKVVDAKLNEIFTLAKEDPFAAFSELIALKGEDPDAFIQKYIEDAQKLAETVSDLSEEDKKKLFQGKKLETENRRLKAQLEKRAAVDSEKQNEAYLSTEMSKHSISDDEFNDAADVLTKAGIDFAGKSAKEITDTTIKFITGDYRKTKVAFKVAGRVDPALTQDPSFMNLLVSMIEPGYTEDDIKEIVEGYLEEDSPKKPKAKKEEPSKTKESNEDDGFDENDSLALSKPTKSQKERKNQVPTSLRTPQKKVAPRAESDADYDDPVTFDELMAPYRR